MNIQRDDFEMSLAEACTPKAYTYDSGAIESVRAQAELNAEVLGRLIAWMVEHQGMGIETARKVCGDYAAWKVTE